MAVGLSSPPGVNRDFKSAISGAGICGKTPPKVQRDGHGIGLRFELVAGHTGLANDGLQRADANFGMIGDGNRHRCTGQLFLHRDVTATAPDLDEPMARQNGTHLLAGEDKELTQPRPLRG